MKDTTSNPKDVSKMRIKNKKVWFLLREIYRNIWDSKFYKERCVEDGQPEKRDESNLESPLCEKNIFKLLCASLNVAALTEEYFIIFHNERSASTSASDFNS